LIKLLHLEFTHIFTTNFVGSLDIRASREVFPIGVRSPEIIYEKDYEIEQAQTGNLDVNGDYLSDFAGAVPGGQKA
jgi:hypothetical protein